MLFQSSIKISFIFLFTSCIFVSTGFSQSISYLDSLEGKFALQFQITDNFTLSNFQGAIFSGKYNFSSRDAIRIGLSADLNDGEYEEVTNYLDTNIVYKNESQPSAFGFRINTQYLRYFRGTKEISFFGCIGPFVGHYTSTVEYKSLAGNIELIRTETADRLEVGANLTFGVEWMFYNNMTLSAEYGLEFLYRSLENSREEEHAIRKSNSKSYSLTYNSVNFGLTVYF